MSRADAEAILWHKTARLLNVRAEALRSEIYGTLERARVGRGHLYTHHLYTDRAGRVRPGKPRKKPHRASAPGDPPARDTGRLMESVKVLRRASPDSLLARVGPDPAAFRGAPYPFFLEYGTRKMAPRPFVRPALASFKSAIRGGRT